MQTMMAFLKVAVEVRIPCASYSTNRKHIIPLLPALASMGTLASLEIISRRQGFATTYHKSIKASLSLPLRRTRITPQPHHLCDDQNGKTSSFIKSEKHAKSSSGTTIILKDIYHTVRLRISHLFFFLCIVQPSLQVRVKRTVGSNSSSSSSTSTIQACKKALELAVLCYASNPLAEPFDLAITLTLEQDPFSDMPSKRLLDIKINTSDILTTFATLFGGALTESARSFRASSHGIQVRGFISFTADGHPTRAHQYVFVNGRYVEQSDLAEVVEDMFKKYRVFDSEEEEDDGRRSVAARGDRAGGKGVGRSVKPVFLLHLTVPTSETDGTSSLKDVPISKVRCHPVYHTILYIQINNLQPRGWTEKPTRAEGSIVDIEDHLKVAYVKASSLRHSTVNYFNF